MVPERAWSAAPVQSAFSECSRYHFLAEYSNGITVKSILIIKIKPLSLSETLNLFLICKHLLTGAPKSKTDGFPHAGGGSKESPSFSQPWFSMMRGLKVGKGDSSNYKIGWERGLSVLRSFKLGHLQPILFWKIFNFFTFILGGQFLLPQRDNNGKREFIQLQNWMSQRVFSARGIQTGPLVTL